MDLFTYIAAQYSTVEVIGWAFSVLAVILSTTWFLGKKNQEHNQNKKDIVSLKETIETLITDLHTFKVESREVTAKEREHFLTIVEGLRTNLHNQLSEFKQDFGTAIAAIKTSTDLTHERMDKILFTMAHNRKNHEQAN